VVKVAKNAIIPLTEAQLLDTPKRGVTFVDKITGLRFTNPLENLGFKKFLVEKKDKGFLVQREGVKRTEMKW